MHRISLKVSYSRDGYSIDEVLKVLDGRSDSRAYYVK
jgi:hypothetical protein